jgi:hypothetical protein
MKRLLAPLFLALCLVVPIGASASHSPGEGPDSDKVDGTVEDIFPSTLHVNAVSDPGGANARGQVWYHAENPGFTINVAGEVTCLNVQGNRATVGMLIDRAKLPGLVGEGDGFLFIVNDNGEPGDLDTHLDIPLANPPTVCPNPFLFVFPHMSGNFVVHDAP